MNRTPVAKNLTLRSPNQITRIYGPLATRDCNLVRARIFRALSFARTAHGMPFQLSRLEIRPVNGLQPPGCCDPCLLGRPLFPLYFFTIYPAPQNTRPVREAVGQAQGVALGDHYASAIRKGLAPTTPWRFLVVTATEVLLILLCLCHRQHHRSLDAGSYPLPLGLLKPCSLLPANQSLRRMPLYMLST